MNYDNYQISNNKTSFTARLIPPKEVAKILREVKIAHKVDIYVHSAPDEDTINSAQVVYKWLKKKGKDVSICTNPKDLKGLFFKRAKNYKINSNPKSTDLAVILDFNSVTRISKDFAKKLFKSKKIIGLDHHNIVDDSLNRHLYVDGSASSCSGIVYRFFEGIGRKLKKTDLENLYCGMLDDYKKSKLIEIKTTKSGIKITKTPVFFKDENSKEVFERVERQLGSKRKNKVHTHFNILNNLTVKEKAFRENNFSKVEVTPNGKLAYLIINPHDKEWASLGMDNKRTSEIIGELRSKLISNSAQDKSIPAELRNKLKNVEGAIIFYRTSSSPKSEYRMSITSKGDYAQRLINYVRNNINPNLVAGGHPNRSGGRIPTFKKEDVRDFISNFLTAAERLG